MTASPCSATARPSEAMTMTSPLRGTESTKGGGFAAAHFLARRAGYGAAPPASRVLRIALRATALRAALDPGDHCGPWEQEERAGQACPRQHARRANPRWRAYASTGSRREQMNWRSVLRTRKINRYSRQTLESVKHHLKPNRQRSVGPRHLCGARTGHVFGTASRTQTLPAAHSRIDRARSKLL